MTLVTSLGAVLGTIVLPAAATESAAVEMLATMTPPPSWQERPTVMTVN